jgi:hypothetical protein
MVPGKIAAALACAAAPMVGAFVPGSTGVTPVTSLAASRGALCPAPAVARAAASHARVGALGLVAEDASAAKSEVSRRQLLGAAVMGALALPVAARAEVMETVEMGADVLDRKEFRQALRLAQRTTWQRAAPPHALLSTRNAIWRMKSCTAMNLSLFRGVWQASAGPCYGAASRVP